MKTLKAVGVAIVLVAAFQPATAGAAAEDEFQADYYPASLSGQQEGAHVLGADGLSVSCKTVTLNGELSTAKKEVEVTPSYTECTALGLPATVAMEGCKFRLDAGGGDMDVVCAAGKSIKVTALEKACEATIGSQNGISGLEYSGNAGPPATVTTKASLKTVKYSKVKDGAFCPFSGIGEKENGTLTGQSLLKAFSAGPQIDMFVGGPADAVLKAPDGLVFALNEIKKFVIENTGGTPLDVVGEGLALPALFKITKKCEGTPLPKKGDTCTSEVECIKTGTGERTYTFLLTGNLNRFVNLKCP